MKEEFHMVNWWKRYAFPNVTQDVLLYCGWLLEGVYKHMIEWWCGVKRLYWDHYARRLMIPIIIYFLNVSLHQKSGKSWRKWWRLLVCQMCWIMSFKKWLYYSVPILFRVFSEELFWSLLFTTYGRKEMIEFSP